MTRSDLAIVGEQLVKTGRPVEAERIFRKALGLDGQDAVAACGLAMLYLARGRLGAAVHFARLAQGLSAFDMRSTVLPRQLGVALWQAGFYTEAAKWLRLYVDKAPWDAQIHALLAQAPGVGPEIELFLTAELASMTPEQDDQTA